MKTHTIHTLTGLLLGGILAISASHAQTTHTVDNNPGSVAMFANFADAYEAAAPGDTILLAGSTTFYGTHTIYKRLHIEGPGYFLVENNIPGLNKQTAQIALQFRNSIQFGNSSNSTVVGVRLEPGSVGTNVTGLLFDKVYFRSVHDFESPVVIRRSYHRAVGSGLDFRPAAGGSSISKSIIQSLSSSTAAVSIDRCIIWQSLQVNSLVSVSNSIFTSNSDIISGSPSVSHCIAVGNYLPTGSSNLNGQFLTGPGGIFQSLNIGDRDIAVLREDSPALGAGTGGSDIGISDGVTPYVPSGVPARPRMTMLSAPNAATDTSGFVFEVSAEAFGD